MMDPEEYFTPPSAMRPAPKWWRHCIDAGHRVTILTDALNDELLVAFCGRCGHAKTIRGRVLHAWECKGTAARSRRAKELRDLRVTLKLQTRKPKELESVCDVQDLKAARNALKEPGRKPWRIVAKELGI